MMFLGLTTTDWILILGFTSNLVAFSWLHDSLEDIEAIIMKIDAHMQSGDD